MIDEAGIDDLITDDLGNSFFTVRGKKYKLPRLNWQYEEKFLIAATAAGLNLTDVSKDSSRDINLFTEQGTQLRKQLIPWLLYEVSDGAYKQLTDDFQRDHFSSIIEVYEVLALEIKAISYFLAQAQPSNPQKSILSPGSALEKAGTISKPQSTS